MREKVGHAIRIIARSETGFRISLHGLEPRKIRSLLQIAHRRGRMAENLARLRFNDPGRDLQKGRFARTVAADQTDLVAGLDLQVRAGQERRAAEVQEDIIEFQDGRGQNQTPERS